MANRINPMTITSMEISKLGRFEILSELGKGAMGLVYKAYDPLLDRTVAIKTLNLSRDKKEAADYEARFYQEAKAAGGLNHPNIVTVYDIGNNDNIAYMAMEHLEGKELRDLMVPGKPLPVKQVIDIATQVCDGLAFAHDHHVVHRDIKPANIMLLHNGLVKITDFGVARRRTSEHQSGAGIVLGSPRYMSPEQILGKRADHCSDIFSLGVVLYEMLTGVSPFTGENLNAMMFQIINLVPPPPQLTNPDVPEMLNYIVAKALAKSLDARYPNVKVMANDLRECDRLMQAGSTGIAAGLRMIKLIPQKIAHSLIDPDIGSELTSTPSPKSRHGDAAAEEASASARAQALRDHRLGEDTVDNMEPFVAQPARSPHSLQWKNREKFLLGVSVILALIVVAILFFA